MIGRHLVTEEELRRMEGPDQLNPVNQISIAESALRILSGGSSVIIEEYNVGTAITLIATLADSHRILIVADGKDIGAIYEYFNDTRTEVGIIAKETQMRSCRCNIAPPPGVSGSNGRFSLSCLSFSYSLKLGGSSVAICSR